MRSVFKTSLILGGFLLLGSTVFGQNKFAFSAMVSPFYGHSKITANVLLPAEDGSGTLVAQEWTSEASSTGLSVGLNGRYSFSQQWSASTGLWFNHLKYKNATSGSRVYNFSIPVMVNFQLSDKKLSPYFSAGALWNFRTTSRLNIPDMGTVIIKSDKNASRISPMVGAGAVYHFAPSWSLIAQPTFTYAIPSSNIKSRTYQVGLNVQLMFGL